MNDSFDARRIERLEPEIVAVLRRMWPAERLAAAFDCNRTMRLRLAGHLKTRHPDWGEEQIQAEIARRMLHGAG
jgi:hypothetical protein